uniref:Zgc:113279 n=1 Tax=Hippocampus comes TaxID=109280 RepID=A0A3Q2YZM3_HIPCM
MAAPLRRKNHCSQDTKKVYLGVRVKMPVKDLLRNIRIAQGRDPQDPQVTFTTKSSFCANTLAVFHSQRKRPTSSLEELAIIVEVLEEDLRTGTTNSSTIQMSSPSSPVSPEFTFESNGNSFLFVLCRTNEWLSLSPSLHRALHSVASDGRRVLAYAIAKRMAALNSLDLKDSDGMTALLLAAKHNHHLIVEDLINLGARVSERNNSGKSCLHLSAEKGFIRVLEVLKRVMLEGVYIDVEATDKYGMSVLQCASVALKATLQQLELSKNLSQTGLHMLRKEQLLETLECLLQMASYSHVMVRTRTKTVEELEYSPMHVHKNILLNYSMYPVCMNCRPTTES